MPRAKKPAAEQPAETRKNKVDQIIKDLNKRLNSNRVRYGNEAPSVFFVPYDLPMLDFLSGGGIPAGRIIEHYGPYSSTKSYASLKAIAAFQRVEWDVTHFRHKLIDQPTSELKTALIDIEGTYTPEWGTHIGIDNRSLIYADPDSIEDAVDIADALLRDEGVSLVVFDSLSAIGDKTEVENSMGKDQMSATARFWNKAVRKLQSAMASNPNGVATLLVINSGYEKLGMVFGDPEEVKNGQQLKLAKSLSTKFNALKLEKGEDSAGGSKEVIGYNISLYNKKNKVGRRGLNGTYYYSHIDDGLTKANSVDVFSQVIELALRFGLIEKRGTFYNYEGQSYQGMKNLNLAFIEEPELLEALKKDVYAGIRNFHSLNPE